MKKSVLVIWLALLKLGIEWHLMEKIFYTKPREQNSSIYHTHFDKHLFFIRFIFIFQFLLISVSSIFNYFAFFSCFYICRPKLFHLTSSSCINGWCCSLAEIFMRLSINNMRIKSHTCFLAGWAKRGVCDSSEGPHSLLIWSQTKQGL